MTKKYFETPSITLVRLTADVIATSVGLNPQQGNGIPQSPAHPIGKRSIWD